MYLRILSILVLTCVALEAKPLEQEAAFNNQPSHIAALAEYLKQEEVIPDEAVSLFIHENKPEFRSLNIQDFPSDDSNFITGVHRKLPEENRDAKVFNPYLVQQHPTHLETSEQSFLEKPQQKVQRLENNQNFNQVDRKKNEQSFRGENQQKGREFLANLGQGNVIQEVPSNQFKFENFQLTKEDDRRFVHNGPESHFLVSDEPDFRNKEQHSSSNFQIPVQSQIQFQDFSDKNQNQQSFSQQNTPSFASTVVQSPVRFRQLENRNQNSNYINSDLPANIEQDSLIIKGNLVGRVIGAPDRAEPSRNIRHSEGNVPFLQIIPAQGSEDSSFYNVPSLNEEQMRNMNPVFREQNIINMLSSKVKINNSGRGNNIYNNLLRGRGFQPTFFDQEQSVQESRPAPQGRSLGDHEVPQNKGKFVPGKLEGGFTPSNFFKL